MRPLQRRTLLLLLCAVHAAIVTCSDSSQAAAAQYAQQHTSQGCQHHSEGHTASSLPSVNSRKLLDRLVLQQQQEEEDQQLQKLLAEVSQVGGSNRDDVMPLLELGRAASTPQQVVIVDTSRAAHAQQRRGHMTNGVEEIVVWPAGAPRDRTYHVPKSAKVTATPRPRLPAPAPVPAPSPVRQTPYCIPQGPNGLTVLAAGDSITQGSVPSKNLNHPYTIRLQEVLESRLQTPVRAVDAGLGGGGVFMTGFNVPVTFGPWLDTYMAQGPWSLVIISIGINDLLRGGKPADDIMNGLAPMIEKVLATNTPVVLMPPFGAPGFVDQHDSKEYERKKLARLFRQYSVHHHTRTSGVGPQVWLMDLQAVPFDFYDMSPSERSRWLDDGLHMTVEAYDTIGQMAAQEIAPLVCQSPTTANMA